MNYQQFLQTLEKLKRAPKREAVLRRLLRGLTAEEIAEEMRTHPGTVRKQISTLYEEFGLTRENDHIRDRFRKRRDLLDLFKKYKPEWVEKNTPDSVKIQPLSGIVPLDSPLYLPRDADEICREVLTADRSDRGSLPFIRIKGSSGMGKSSLLVRLRDFLEREENQVVGFVDLADLALDPEIFEDLNLLLKRFTQAIADTFSESVDKLNPPPLEKNWQKERSSGLNCTNYLEDFIFTPIQQPKTLLIDGIDEILGPDKPQNPFLKLLRSWNEKRMKVVSQSPIVWPSIAIAYSTEPYPELDIKGSILQNVGLEVELPEFNTEEILKLAKKYRLEWSEEEVQPLKELIGGHPTLVNQALYKISQEQMSWSELESQATLPTGPFGDHLLKKFSIIYENYKNTDLKHCFDQLLRGGTCTDEISKFQLEKAGLIKIDNAGVQVRFKLYQKSFTNTL
ncbi:AAA-like domain-containing protein [Laspinema olomoucense]|uniref:AAA-like domain-containing protein n=1 Tax=Laspinema olomoucense D3b TaxID=2953688 RepID=A0ABT2NCB9_9CYAN|nr:MULTISPECIES: AAA-like domain-containing protein [unclassified Laspinema]MCT7980131.1 AAA-like domain-containing protein [Laspinema sp. D3b]MCT7992110.1 AAA-like domain-containing protein [Laspinema sp. D3c]